MDGPHGDGIGRFSPTPNPASETWTRIEQQTPPSDWALYWRGAVIISLAIGTLIYLVDGSTGDTKFLLLSLTIILVAYPGYLLIRNLTPGGWLLYSLILGPTPLFIAAIAYPTLFIAKISRLSDNFRFLFPVFLALAVLGGVLGPLTAEVAPPKQSAQRPSNGSPVAAQPKAVVASTAKKQAENGTSATVKTETYRDRLGFYGFEIPTGYSKRGKSASRRSKTVFNYGKDMSMTVIASVMNKPWDAQIAMATKTRAIEQGRAPIPDGVRLVNAHLVEIAGMTGYELNLYGFNEGKDVLINSYALSNGKTSLSISLVSTSADSHRIYEALQNSVRNTLHIPSKARRSKGNEAYRLRANAQTVARTNALQLPTDTESGPDSKEGPALGEQTTQPTALVAPPSNRTTRTPGIGRSSGNGTPQELKPSRQAIDELDAYLGKKVIIVADGIKRKGVLVGIGNGFAYLETQMNFLGKKETVKREVDVEKISSVEPAQ